MRDNNFPELNGLGEPAMGTAPCGRPTDRLPCPQPTVAMPLRPNRTELTPAPRSQLKGWGLFGREASFPTERRTQRWPAPRWFFGLQFVSLAVSRPT